MKLILFIALFFLFIKWWFKDDNFYTTNLYIGKMGTGKTTHIAMLSQRLIRKGYKVYCNIDIPGTYLYNPLEIDQYTFEANSIVFLDEMGLIFNNRLWANKKNKGIDYIEFFKFCRQYKIQFHGYTQALDVDKGYMNILHNLFIMHRIGRITLIRPVIKKLGIATDVNGNGQIVDTYKYKGVLSWKFIYLPRYYGLFNTYNPPSREIISSTLTTYNELSSIYLDTKKRIIYKIKSFFIKQRNRLRREKIKD